MRGGEPDRVDSRITPAAFEPLTLICSGASGPSRLTLSIAMVPNLIHQLPIQFRALVARLLLQERRRKPRLRKRLPRFGAAAVHSLDQRIKHRAHFGRRAALSHHLRRCRRREEHRKHEGRTAETDVACHGHGCTSLAGRGDAKKKLTVC